jgi:2-polyprenyl-6-methoxyphenol hydroxylase-like FAD-dependent oxidoreductase
MDAAIDTDVLIAGGGPFGLMLANELGRRGVRCLLVDPKPGTSFNPQANATQARTMEHFRRLGFASEIRAQGLPADHASDIAYFTRYTAHELARLQLPTAAQAVRSIRGMKGSWSAAELPHRVSQKYVEATLRKHAEALPGVDLRYGWALESFEDRGAHVLAAVRQQGALEATAVTACYLVGADGPRSMVRNRLGIAWSGASGIKREFMGGRMFAVYLRAPAFYDVLKSPRAWMYVSVNPQRRAFMASVDGLSEFAFHAAVHDGEDADRWTADDAERIFSEALGASIPIEVLSVGTWTAGHSLVAQRFQLGRVLIGGDAAHLFTPTGGLGYNTAVEDAVNLGWKLAAVIRGAAPAQLLESYELERKPLAERNTAYAQRFADSIGRFKAEPALEQEGAAGDSERQRASDYLNAHVRLEFNIPGVTFGGRYDGSPLIVKDGSTPPQDVAGSYEPSASPGGRAPHAWLDDGSSLYDGFGFDWTLLVLGPAAPDVRAFVESAATLGLELKVVRPPGAALVALYGAPLILIRPDQIVAWRGSDAASAMQVLAQASGHPAGSPALSNQ